MTISPNSNAPATSDSTLLEKRPLERYVPPAKPSLIGLSRLELAEALAGIGVPPPQQRMRVQQLWHWLYVRGAQSFDAMTSISKELRAELDRHFTLARPEVVAEQISADGTRKWLLRLPGAFSGEVGTGSPSENATNHERQAFSGEVGTGSPSENATNHERQAFSGAGGTGSPSENAANHERQQTSERPHEVECVYIPETDRGTLCISSQVGCTLNCSFCHTGTQRLVRNLTAGEIVGQVMIARDRLGDWPGGAGPAVGAVVPTEASRLVSNVVVMGMGEPLYNFEAVRDALLIVADNEGLALSKRRITLSTSGVVPLIPRVGAEIGCMLAVSLHAVTDAVRNELVPLNRKYPIAELMQACRDYPGLTNAKRITFEYVMLKGVNDSLADAKALVKLIKGIPAKINLIPFNPWPGTRYECSDWDQIERFSEYVFKAGYSSPVRTPRGRDILAACGQLKSATEKLSARERLALRAMAMTE